MNVRSCFLFVAAALAAIPFAFAQMQQFPAAGQQPQQGQRQQQTRQNQMQRQRQPRQGQQAQRQVQQQLPARPAGREKNSS